MHHLSDHFPPPVASGPNILTFLRRPNPIIGQIRSQANYRISFRKICHQLILKCQGQNIEAECVWESLPGKLTGGQASSNLCENLRIIHNAICPHPTVVRNVPNYRGRIASLPVQRSNLWIHQGTPLVLYSISSIQVWKAPKANSNLAQLNTNSEMIIWSHVVILN